MVDLQNCQATGKTASRFSANGRMLVFPILLLTGLGIIIYGCISQQLWKLERLWPNSSLAVALGISISHAAACVVIWSSRYLRARHRLITAMLVTFMIAAGAGLAGLSTVALILTSALAVGDLICHGSVSAGFDTKHLPSRLFTSLVGGLAVWALIFWGLVHFPINTAVLYLALLATPLVIARKRLHFFGSVAKRWLLDLEQVRIGGSHFSIACLAMFFLLIQIAVSMWPEVGYDALSLHFRIATVVRQRGLFDFNFQEHVCVLMPYFADWLFFVAHILGGEISAKLLNGSFFVILALGCLILVRRSLPSGWAWLSVLILAATPMFLTTTHTLFSENLLGLAAFGILFALVDYNPRKTIRHDVFIAILLGFPALVKTTGLVLTAVGFVAWVVYLFREKGGRSTLRTVAVAVPIVLLVVLPPYVKSWIITGNPVFPLFNALFKSPFFSATNFPSPMFSGMLTWDILYQLTFKTSAFTECENGALGLAYMLVVPFAVMTIVFVRNRTVWLSLILSTAFAASVLINIQYARYLLPVFPMYVAVALIGLRTMSSRFRTENLVKLLLIILCSMNLFLLPSGMWTLRGLPLQTAFSAKARDKLIARKAPTRKLILAINAHCAKPHRVIFLDRPYPAGLRGTALINGWYNSGFRRRIDLIKNRAELIALLRRTRASHVIFGFHFRHPLKSLFKNTLMSVADLEYELNGQQLFRIRETSLMYRELLTNTMLSMKRRYWRCKSCGAIPNQQDGVALLSGGSIRQQIQVDLPGQKVVFEAQVRTETTASCLIRMQIRWFLSNSSVVPVWVKVRSVRKGWATLSSTVSVPRHAISAVAYLVHQRCESPILVRKVSLRH